MSTVQRWLQDGLLVGKQVAAFAPWQIDVNSYASRHQPGLFDQMGNTTL